MPANTYTLQNDRLSITVQAKGAELISLYNKTQHLEYMWSGDPAFWSKHSPVLFPIIGALKNNTYYILHLILRTVFVFTLRNINLLSSAMNCL